MMGTMTVQHPTGGLMNHGNVIGIGHDHAKIRELMKEGLIEIFETAFSKASSKTRKKFSKNELKNFSICEEFPSNDITRFLLFECSIVELVFICLYRTNVYSFEKISDEDLVALIRRHIEEFNSTIFDNAQKASAAFDPWSSRMGFIHQPWLNNLPFTVEQMNEAMQGDPELFEIFRKFLFVIIQCEPEGDVPLGEMNFGYEAPWSEESPNFSYIEELGESFLKFPLFSENFKGFFNGLTAAEIHAVRWKNFPEAPSEKVFFGVIDHAIDVDEGFNKEVMDASPEWDSFRKCILNANLNETSIGMFTEDAVSFGKKKGYRTVAPEYFKKFGDNIDKWIDFYNAAWKLNGLPYSTNEFEDGEHWILDSHSWDFILLQSYKTLGVEETFEIVERIRASSEVLTSDQWLSVIDNYELLKDVPVSWWVAMVCDPVD